MQSGVQDRLVGGAGAAIMLAGLGWALLLGLTIERRPPVARIAPVLLRLDPPPRVRVPPPPPKRPSRAARPASPRNLRNAATEIVAPLAPLPAPPAPIIVAPKAATGMAANTGASDRPGPGECAGGPGNGTGGGGTGDEGDDTPPRWLRGRLKFTDLPRSVRDAEIGGTVGVRYRVLVDGHVGDCAITASSGNSELDDATCRLIEQRFRFDPSRDADGRPVRSMITERHSWIVERPVDTGRHD